MAAWIGDDIVVSERRKGYASEGIRALLDWAWATGRVQTCVASVSPHNAPSLALIHSFGFRHVGEQIDEIDGLELVFERRLPLVPRPAWLLHIADPTLGRFTPLLPGALHFRLDAVVRCAERPSRAKQHSPAVLGAGTRREEQLP